MLRLTIEECAWGTDPLQDGMGLQINLLDEKSGVMVHVPFNPESLTQLVKDAILVLSDEQKKEIAGLIKPKPAVRKRATKAK